MAQSLPSWIEPSTAAAMSGRRRARASTPRDFSVVRVRSNPTRTAGGRRRSRNVDEVSAGHEPLVLGPRWATRYAVRGRRPAASGLLDLVAVVLVVLGELPQVPGGDSGEPGGFADRELVVGRPGGRDRVGIDPGLPGVDAPGQLGLGHPPRPVRVDDRDEVRALWLDRDGTGNTTGNSTTGNSHGNRFERDRRRDSGRSRSRRRACGTTSALVTPSDGGGVGLVVEQLAVRVRSRCGSRRRAWVDARPIPGR